MFDKKLQESVEISITNPEKAYKIAKAFLDQSIDEKHIEQQLHSLSVMAY